MPGYDFQEHYQSRQSYYNLSQQTVYAIQRLHVKLILDFFGEQLGDRDLFGVITVDELQEALLNGNWSPFNQETCRLLIKLFDNNK